MKSVLWLIDLSLISCSTDTLISCRTDSLIYHSFRVSATLRHARRRRVCPPYTNTQHSQIDVCQKSPIFCQKSPIFIQKEHKTQARVSFIHEHTQNSVKLMSHKRGEREPSHTKTQDASNLYLTIRALYSVKRALYSVKRAVYSFKRALYSVKRILYSVKRALYAVQNAL